MLVSRFAAGVKGFDEFSVLALELAVQGFFHSDDSPGLRLELTDDGVRLVGDVAEQPGRFVVVRVRHLALIMITLGIGLLLYEMANRESWLTGGNDGLAGVAIWKLFGRFDFDLYGYTAYGYALAVLLLVVLAARRLIHSPFGLSLRAIRENERRMPAIGAPSRARLHTVYTIAAAIAGIAGGLLAQTTQFVDLSTLGFQRSADLLVMLALGGTGRLYGGIVGAIVFMVARDQLADMNPQYWYFWIGLLLVGVVLFLPNGILGGLARLLPGARGVA